MGWTTVDQAHPEAVRIVERISGKPLVEPFRGLDDSFWHKLLQDKAAVREFVDLLVADFPTFCVFMMMVVPKGGFARPFLFNNPQRLVWAIMCKLIAGLKPLFLCVLKARQLGMSTFFAAWVMWHTWRQNDLQAIVITHELKLAEHIIGMMRVAYEHFPDIEGIKPKLRKGNQGATIPRGELYYADRRSGAVLHVAKNLDPRGMSAPILWESEKAFFPNAAQLDGALLPQLPSLGTPERARCSFISESTPYGQNYFYEEYMKGEPVFSAQATWGRNRGREMKSVFLPWMVHDETEFGGYAVELPKGFKLTTDEKRERNRLSLIRHTYDGKDVTPEQMLWRRLTLADQYHGDEDRFNMEYPSDDISCFLMMSDSAFRHVIKYLQECTVEAKIRATAAFGKRGITTDGAMTGKMLFTMPVHEGKEMDGQLTDVRFAPGPGPMKVWEPPEKGERYVAFLDPCNGVEGGDNAVITVLSVRNARQVAEWVDIVNPVRAVDMLCAIGSFYNTALINAEINVHGYTILNRANERHYHNQFRWPKFDEANRLTHKRFWETTSRSRNMMFSTMLHWFEEKMIAIASKDLLAELSTFEKRYESDEGDETLRTVFKQQKHCMDDRVMAFAGAIQTIKQAPKYHADFTPYVPIPTAQELHLQAGVATISLERIAQKDEEYAELADRLFGTDQSYPWNPLRAGLPF